MTTSIESDKKALFILPSVKEGSTPEKGLLSWSRPDLITMAQAEGVDMLVSRGPGSIDIENRGVNSVIRPEYGPNKDQVRIKALGRLSLDEFGVVRNISSPVPVEGVTFLNPNYLRAMARDKYKIGQDVLAAAGVYGRASRIINPTEDSSVDINEKIDSINGDVVVLKPNWGMRSRGVFVGTKPEAKEFATTIEEPYIVEEKLDFSHAFPVVKGHNQHEQDRLNYANSNGVNKELRVFYFGENEDVDVVARVARPGETNFIDDKWLYVDQDFVPEEVLKGVSDIVGLVRGKTGSADFNIALDWVFASTAGQQPRWNVMELNANQPQLVYVDQDKTVGTRQHQKLARQIARLAVK